MSVHKSAHIDWMDEQDFASEVQAELARESAFFAERAFPSHSVDFEDEAAIAAMIDHAMAIEEAEEELFDHAANFEV